MNRPANATEAAEYVIRTLLDFIARPPFRGRRTLPHGSPCGKTVLVRPTPVKLVIANNMTARRSNATWPRSMPRFAAKQASITKWCGLIPSVIWSR